MKIHFAYSRKNIIKGFGIIVGLISLWLLRSKISAFMTWVVDRQAVENTIQRLGVWGPLLIFAVMVLQVFMAVIPGHALVLKEGMYMALGSACSSPWGVPFWAVKSLS
jgi:uncharacterized membrane protein YdjX (TVP38/TMEM64 family)